MQNGTAAAPDLVALCTGLLPVWTQHLATSRAQSEVAVTDMLKAFADIGPHLDLAERQSKQITEALSQPDGGTTGLVEACERALAPVLANPQIPVDCAQALRHVLGMVQQAVDALQQIAKPFHHETMMVAEQVERMYMGFQYQDRTSQMMTLLESDMGRLLQALTIADQPLPDLAQWLSRLESQYAMAEQRQDHAHATGGAVAGDSKETTFF
jgi:hypothetical protein